MVKFAYKNIKNTTIGQISFEQNWGYHPRVFYEDDVGST